MTFSKDVLSVGPSWVNTNTPDISSSIYDVIKRERFDPSSPGAPTIPGVKFTEMYITTSADGTRDQYYLSGDGRIYGRKILKQNRNNAPSPLTQLGTGAIIKEGPAFINMGTKEPDHTPLVLSYTPLQSKKAA